VCALTTLPRRSAAVHALALLLLSPAALLAGGPKYVAGTSFFDPAVLGQPIHWSQGQVNYYVDQGPLSNSISNQQAAAMVDAAAALWSEVPTAGVTLTRMGSLNEDVNGSSIAVNSSGQITAPADVAPSSTAYPLAILYDADGSVINALYGSGASDPTSCENNGVFFWIDNIRADATIGHAVIVLNGLCTTTPELVAMMSYEIERAFGRILGLDYSQVNPGALANNETGGTAGWPVMQPLSGVCGPLGGVCIPNPSALRFDDIAALNRIYPITSANLAQFPSKQLTAANTISIQGAIAFPTGYGMQGVNVVARPLDSSGNPLLEYTVSFVSGAYFGGNHGNPVTGWEDDSGNPLAQWGSTDAALQGYFDLSGIPLPPGVGTASYQLSFESINPLYILEDSVGPYAQGQVAPSGALNAITLPALSAGSARTLSITASGASVAGYQDAIGAQDQPRPMPATGLWCGRLSQVGQTDWFTFPVRGNRIFTIVTQAVSESGMPSNQKALPSIGVWDAFDVAGATPVGAAPGLNGFPTGETWLRVDSSAADIVRIGIADLRGDGRPDYAYNDWLLYADTIAPQRLPAAGGPIVIHGTGFRLADTVLVGGQPALVTSISPNEITAIAPPAASGVSGSVDVEVDDLPIFYAAAIVPSGVSYDSGSGDALTLLAAPSGQVPIGVPTPFTVTALGPDLSPAGGVTVTYEVTGGSAALGCGAQVCGVTATGDGRASILITPTGSQLSSVTAMLTNGSSLQAVFSGGSPPVLSPLTPQLSLAAGSAFTWTVQALALSGGIPAAGQSVLWQSSSGIAAPAVPVLTNSSGIATQILTAGPLAEGQLATISACANGTAQCAAFTALGSRPEYATLHPVSGTSQSIAVSQTPAQIVLRVLDMDGNPMAGATVELYQSLHAWTAPCAPHTVCSPGPLLLTQSATAISAIDGTVVFAPASFPAIATVLSAEAATGLSSNVSITIEQHP